MEATMTLAHFIDDAFGAVFLVTFWGLVIWLGVVITRKVRRK